MPSLPSSKVTWYRRVGWQPGKRASLLFFILLICAMSGVYRYDEILLRGPQGFHNWRQSDCLSITANYMQDGTGFTDSRIHYLGPTGGDRAISDLPLFYYGFGKLWRLTGKKEWTYRLLVLVFFMAGLAALFLTLRDLLNDGFVGAMIAALLFTSPMVAYYGNNFLMNSPALSLVFIAWYLVLRYIKKPRRGVAIVAIALFTLAGLLKATAALSLLSVFIICLLHASPLRKQLLPGLELGHRGLILIACMGGFLLMALWYTFAHAYNVENNSGVFLVGTLPYWKASPDQLKQIWIGIHQHFKRDYFRPDLYPVILGALFFLIVRWRAVPRSLLVLLGLVVCGFLGICLLFFQALRDHDYYTLDQIFLVPFVLALAVIAAQAASPWATRAWWMQLAMIVLLVHCADFTRRRMLDRYGGWMNKEYLERLEPLSRMKPYMEGLGITANERVICLPDFSFNISLYLLDRKGWTDFDSLSFYPDRVQDRIDMGARYLITYNDSILTRPGVSPFIDKPIGAFESVRLYDLSGRSIQRSN